MAPPQPPLVAIGRRLARFPQFTTLGLRPNLDDYPPEHLCLIREAKTIYYPTNAFAEQLAAMGKRLFPSLACHQLDADKIKQTNLFQLLGLPHPRTRVFYGRQERDIERRFAYPFIAKTPRGSFMGRGVYLIKDPQDLAAYLAQPGNHPAYIQELLPIDRDLRVIVIGFQAALAYWRIARPGEFRNNVAQGAAIDFAGIPPQAVELAEETARRADLDEVGMDIAMVQGRPLLLEFNVKYGRSGPKAAGLDLVALVAGRILDGEL